MTALSWVGASVLLVSEDAVRAQPFAAALGAVGFTVTVDAEAARALERVVARPVDAVLVMSGPGMRAAAAIAWCAALRRRQLVPILLMLGELAAEALHVEAFASGVDDCVGAACSPRETAARVGAVLRRVRWAPVRGARTLEVGKLLLDSAVMEARFDGRSVHLTQYEFELLKALAEQAGRVLTREELMERAKGSVEDSFDRSIDVHICRLRAKLGDVRKRQRVLKTVRGVGYLLSPE
jgi:DNA-binding response OmpR family regulator